jgi:hypothetical protein
VADRNPDQVWRDFTGNKAMLARHQVKPNELEVLSQVNLLGKVRHHVTSFSFSTPSGGGRKRRVGRT